jgi:hypothetical protein
MIHLYFLGMSLYGYEWHMDESIGCGVSLKERLGQLCVSSEHEEAMDGRSIVRQSEPAKSIFTKYNETSSLASMHPILFWIVMITVHGSFLGLLIIHQPSGISLSVSSQDFFSHSYSVLLFVIIIFSPVLSVDDEHTSLPRLGGVAVGGVVSFEGRVGHLQNAQGFFQRLQGAMTAKGRRH